MDDKRQFNRWLTEKQGVATLSWADHKLQCDILDMSAGGMRVSAHDPVEVGSIIYSEFKVLNAAYYAKGVVNRLNQDHDDWEVAISFEKVSTIPLHA